jgi:hypothetical protein
VGRKTSWTFKKGLKSLTLKQAGRKKLGVKQIGHKLMGRKTSLT